MSIYVLHLFLMLPNILQVKADKEEEKVVNLSVGDTTYDFKKNFYAFAFFDPGEQAFYRLIESNIFDFDGSTFIIKFEDYHGSSVECFMYVKCNLIDKIEYIEINKCNISLQNQ
ncbi:hypothetical protein RF11_13740 [Thelohanellus kitauei]|uniref:Uncharacterized protein n=1 Tax=Thelohanellus kitauei TaxID=669202 RepID=A0A0C2MZQ0_THEKT|nr:hypothetical protein RF11_13740 [Thelohanellus kitauei]